MSIQIRMPTQIQRADTQDVATLYRTARDGMDTGALSFGIAGGSTGMAAAGYVALGDLISQIGVAHPHPGVLALQAFFGTAFAGLGTLNGVTFGQKSYRLYKKVKELGALLRQQPLQRVATERPQLLEARTPLMSYDFITYSRSNRQKLVLGELGR